MEGVLNTEIPLTDALIGGYLMFRGLRKGWFDALEGFHTSRLSIEGRKDSGEREKWVSLTHVYLIVSI